MTIRIGLSGWSYPEWRGGFYPPGLPSSKWLGYASGLFNTLEVNRTFYSLVEPGTFRSWYQQVPKGFVFSLKGSRYITHMKKLRDPVVPLANFLASGVLLLGEKLGPMLWQLPGSWKLDLDRLSFFLSALPHTFDEAVGLARSHDQRVAGLAVPNQTEGALTHVLEVRNHSWLVPEVFELARKRRVALARSHAATWPMADVADDCPVYLRLHGPDQLYSSAYSSESLDRWAERVRQWDERSDVYVYFDNDSGGHAPRDAAELMKRLG